MELHEIVGTLLTDDIISSEEAILLLQPSGEEFEPEREKTLIVAELLFGQLITKPEALTLLMNTANLPYEDEDDEEFFNKQEQENDMIWFTQNFQPVQFSVN